MYEIFAELLKKKGVTPYQVHKATGVAQSSLSDWKNGKSKPKYEKMQKIADYFGVSVDYLLGNEPKEKAPTVEVDDGRSAKRKMLFDLFNSMTDEELDAMIAFTNAIQKKIDEKKK